MNPYSRDWGIICGKTAIIVIPLLIFHYFSLFLTFVSLVNLSATQLVWFWQNLLSAQSAIAAILGIVLGFSGVVIFYQMRRYDLYLIEAYRLQEKATQVALERGAREIIDRMFEGETLQLPNEDKKTAWEWTQDKLLGMRDRFAIFARTYVGWTIVIILFALLILELMILPPIFVLPSTEIVTIQTSYGIMFGHTLTMIFTISIFFGFFIIITSALAEEKPAVDLMKAISLAIKNAEKLRTEELEKNNQSKEPSE